MLRRFSDALAWTALLAASTATSVAAGGGGAEQLCALPTASLEAAVAQYADSAFAIDEIKKHAIATWYTDRESSDSCSSKVRDIVSHCDESSRITLVVYGLPNKDCAAGYSSGGSNKNADDYKKWVQTLADGVGQRKALYVLEPDAVGLLANGGCGASAGYAENVKAALQILSKNPNADIYLDVGYWTLFSESDAAGVAKTVKDLATGGRLKGIALNTSNYRSNKQISDLCGTFQKAYGDSSLNCIIDTSRNYNENPPSSEWCNAKFGGVGRPPSGDTGFNNLDYFIWIKPAGESDGTCDGGDHTSDAMKGPAAGSFFKELFVNLWNNGYFVKEKSYPVIDGSIRPTPAPTVPDQSTPTTQAPVSQSPTPTTTAPISQSPVSDSPVVTTPAPTETTPAPTTSTPTTFAPISQAPVPTSSAPVGQYPASTESGEIPTPTTPAPSKKKSRKHKKCDSNLEQLPEDLDAESVSGSVKTADAGALGNVTAKSVSFSTLEENSRVAPDTSNAVGASDSANTKSSESGSLGLSGAVIAAIVVAGVMGVAAAAISVRRRTEWRQRADTIRTPARTPVEIVGVHVTPGGITVL